MPRAFFFPTSNARRLPTLLLLLASILTTQVHAAPVASPWPAPGGGDACAVASAAVAGVSAVASSTFDRVEVRDAEQNLLRSFDRAQITAALPWASLDASADGPCGLALTDSGRVLFIGVSDVASPPDGLPPNAILRLDVDTGALSVFARLAIAFADPARPRLALAHFKGRLYAGATGSVVVYRAQMNDGVGAPLFVAPFVAGQQTVGLAVDRDLDTLYAATPSQISRAAIGAGSLPFVSVGTRSNLRALAFSDHYGGLFTPGLYALESTPTSSTLWFVSLNQARGLQTFAPTNYHTTPAPRRDLAASADGSLLLAADDGAASIRDSSDARPNFRAWMRDEFDQVVRFGRSLISPDGEPPGWVIDADVQLGWTRFHPATADSAAWTLLLLLMNDEVLRLGGGPGDPTALPSVRSILQRYAGQASDGIRPLRSADGLYWHWLDPATGGPKAGWGDSYATLSTMKIVLAASRAAAYYPADAGVQSAAREIVCTVRNWDAYFGPAPNRSLSLLGLAGGGPQLGSASAPFNEGVIFADQAGTYGGAIGAAARTRWLDRAASPVASILSGRFVTGDAPGAFLPAFASLYPLLTIADFRGNPAWQSQIASLRQSNAAWTDDFGPRFNTVFSAGTTRSDWGGYHADSLSSHPGDVTTFTSLEGFAAGTGAPGSARVPEAVGAYHAYRRGARQTFRGGASILYRRSNVDRTYQPDSAGLPDVALGGLGLGELLSPGIVARVLTGPYLSCAACVADVDDGTGSGMPDGGVTIDDLLYYLFIFESGDPRADVDDGNSTGTPDGGVTIDDLLYFLFRFESGC